MSLIRTHNGWVQLSPPDELVTKAPKDPTLLESMGVRQESNQAEWDYLHKAFWDKAIGEQAFMRAMSDIRKKPVGEVVIFKDGRKYVSVKSTFFGKTFNGRKAVI
jgi:hypothetical protein